VSTEMGCSWSFKKGRLRNVGLCTTKIELFYVQCSLCNENCGHTEHLYLPEYKMTMHVKLPPPLQSYKFQETQNLYCVWNFKAAT
jgi:hypothetical protein